jgi:hypothetical protein
MPSTMAPFPKYAHCGGHVAEHVGHSIVMSDIPDFLRAVEKCPEP